jgi:photosystem II stability/assembly factor-like uncharacterized protein
MEAETEMQGIVYALAASPVFKRDGVCFAACASGLYRSDDGGLTWRGAYASLSLSAPLATTVVAVSPTFAADRSMFAGVHGAVLRSIDGGQTWDIVALPSPPPQVSFLAVSPDFTRDGMVLAATLEDGVFRSADRGGSWRSSSFGLLDLNVLALAFSPGFAADGTIFVGTDSGIFRSKNGGLAWREVDFPSEFAPVLSLALSPNYDSDGVLFAGTDSCGLFRSGDRGNTWVRLGEGAIAESVNSVLLSPKFPVESDILVLTGETLLVSRDGGLTWSEWKADLDLRGVTSVATPGGLGAGAAGLLGLLDGRVLRI